MVDGRVLGFSAGGVYNGLVLLIDDQTRTYWDHITGEAVHGRLAGARLGAYGLMMTTVAAALDDDPGLTVSISRPRGLRAWLMGIAHRRKIGTRGFIPPPFWRTMAPRDARLDTRVQGLGVVVDGEARFYPTDRIGDGITDDWHGSTLRVRVGAVDGVPFAEWADGGRPFQLFTRWYGFSFTFPGCAIRGTG